MLNTLNFYWKGKIERKCIKKSHVWNNNDNVQKVGQGCSMFHKNEYETI